MQGNDIVGVMTAQGPRYSALGSGWTQLSLGRGTTAWPGFKGGKGLLAPVTVDHKHRAIHQVSLSESMQGGWGGGFCSPH